MRLRSEKAVVSFGVAALLHPTFQAVATWASMRAVPSPRWLITPLDRWLPVIPETVWLYLSWYPATAAVLLMDRVTFRRMYGAYLLAFVACVVSHLLFPVAVDRPTILETSGISAAVLGAVYAADQPVNLFPSFHAAVAGVLTRLELRSGWLRFGLVVWMVAVCMSCVLTKQHYVLDVVAGAAVGWSAVGVIDLARGWANRTARSMTYQLYS